MTYSLRFHPAVRHDLERIALWITDYAGVAAAKHIIDQIDVRLTRLVETPHIGTVRTDLADGVRVIPTARRGAIIFTVDDRSRVIFVHMISYAGEDWTRTLPQRRIEPGGETP